MDKKPNEYLNCGGASETENQFCQSCTQTRQQLIDISVKYSAMIRYAPLYFYNAISLYRLWQINSRQQRVLKRARVIADWLDSNKHNEVEKEKYRDLHVMFIEFVASFPTSQAEKKVEEMFKVLEER